MLLIRISEEINYRIFYQNNISLRLSSQKKNSKKAKKKRERKVAEDF